jgi:hypothetical protein
MLALLCPLVAPLPIGTNLGPLHLLWMVVSERLLATRGAVFAGLSDCLSRRNNCSEPTASSSMLWRPASSSSSGQRAWSLP